MHDLLQGLDRAWHIRGTEIDVLREGEVVWEEAESVERERCELVTYEG